MNYWLFKTEPGCFSLDDLKNRPNMTEHWDVVRNYQARNFLWDTAILVLNILSEVKCHSK
jgi:predicted RNA-binding protein with PUA-like domain